jgi:hypothetical protein
MKKMEGLHTQNRTISLPISEFCVGLTEPNFPHLAGHFKSVLNISGFKSSLDFDPFFASNARRTQWWIQCTESGQFPVYNPEAPFRAQMINSSFYESVCRKLFGMSPLLRGYRSPRIDGVFKFVTYGTADIDVNAMRCQSDNCSEVYVVPIDGDSWSYELNWSATGSGSYELNWNFSESVKRVRDYGVELALNWTRRFEVPSRASRILGHWKCNDGYSDWNCDMRMLTYRVFHWAPSLATLFCTFVFLAVGLFAWCFLLNEESVQAIVLEE